ncbi:MAG: DNA mismatch repair endonuclease MutL [candidate division WOR-3 bacterium]
MENKNKRIIELPEEVRSKIAAGEVVEGPFSCVKELVENAIDAESSQITIDVEEGGKKLIAVSDNGIGIHPDDLSLVIRRYSTSKIKDLEDLDSISSLGFRGEALASISAVSEVEILSKSSESDIGKYIRVFNGEIKEEKLRQRQRGTSVIVRYLFNNYPARRKFLHSSNAEFKKILGEVIPKCISYPEISFVLNHNGKKVIDEPSTTMEDRILSILGEDFFSSLLPIEFVSDDERIKIMGWIQRPELPSQKKYFLFVNKRNVWDGKIFKIIKDFYTPFTDENPSFILFIDLLPELVDVNVHPTKREVKFREEEFIFSLIKKSLNEYLGKGSNYRKELFSFQEDNLLFETKDDKTKFWQLHNSYIVAQTSVGLVIIDQHAAHERIIYDNLKKNESFLSQKLMFPIQIKHTPLEILKLEELRDKLEKLGFSFRIFSGNTVLWEGIPSIIPEITEDKIKGILEDLSEGKDTSIDEMLRTLSCHLAIKAGESLSVEEMENLINLLFTTDKPYRCPHGRPILFEITLQEIEKKLLR